ncbi:hypothetical protein NDU88_001507 [Pleurodeles waltl]|uniref:Uncharacterized protein n=1 Tax=Pleurodeles waltl TaxID=8319 RepID=A0AAV7SA95_PLEWA|nr:hypothetical protein NDU88_001507 [Pleurodeles waltl]
MPFRSRGKSLLPGCLAYTGPGGDLGSIDHPPPTRHAGHSFSSGRTGYAYALPTLPGSRWGRTSLLSGPNPTGHRDQAAPCSACLSAIMAWGPPRPLPLPLRFSPAPLAAAQASGCSSRGTGHLLSSSPQSRGQNHGSGGDSLLERHHRRSTLPQEAATATTNGLPRSTGPSGRPLVPALCDGATP